MYCDSAVTRVDQQPSVFLTVLQDGKAAFLLRTHTAVYASRRATVNFKEHAHVKCSLRR